MSNFNIDAKSEKRTFTLEGTTYECPALSARRMATIRKRLKEWESSEDKESPEGIQLPCEMLSELLSVSPETFLEVDLRKVRMALEYIFDTGDAKKN